MERALNYELAPIPTTLFQDNAEIRYRKVKSVFKTILGVTFSDRIHQDSTALVIDGGALFWTID